ncbi:GATA transcription factor 27-like [Triticum dicoccoides]|uniref:GATA transcription factor 27-like n=1 Tax=Triticum dicoccoides TaxID=85692 RepID=UPI000E7C3D0C|nr:GATA transcription factor 27-like [Triticum dicoccoides]
MVKVKKEGPCFHCRVMSSPLWRHGPPEKPVLCNACGTRWRKKGTLENYTPAPQVQRKQPKKTPVRTTVKKEPYSDHNSLKTGDAADTFSNNPSAFGSALSYSGSAQSHAREPLVPSRKKSCVSRRKPSPLETLVDNLNSIMHEEQLCSGSGLGTIPGSSEEDLLIYHSETPASCFEIGYGSMLLTHPNSVSEANSVPAHSKSYAISQSYLGPASFTLHSGSNGARHELHYSKQHILESKKVEGRGDAGGAFRGLTKSTTRSLKRLYES